MFYDRVDAIAQRMHGSSSVVRRYYQENPADLVWPNTDKTLYEFALKCVTDASVDQVVEEHTKYVAPMLYGV